MALKLMGRKRGMVQLFDPKGNILVGTAIEVEPNVVTQIKTKESDGYVAIQLGFEKVQTKDPRTALKRTKKPQIGHFSKNEIVPRRHLAEAKLKSVDGYSLGQEITIAAFANVSHVDVTGISKGKGYQGVIKLHHFAGGPASHGSGFHRHAGSTGMRSTPGRCLPGGKRASHMGHEQVTVQNLKVIQLAEADNVIIVTGAVPGPTNGLVIIAPAVKLALAEAS